MSKNNYLSASSLKQGLGWILLTIGICLYIISFFAFPLNPGSIWKQIFLKLADVLVIGSVLGFMTNAARFLGIFKQDLQDIIYGKEFVEQRKDNYTVWENLTKNLFENKFPIIHQDLLKAIKNYLPQDEVSFYSDHEAHTIIEWANKEKGIIKVTETITFDLISETDKEIHYPIKTWTINSEKADYKNDILSITVDGENAINSLSEKKETRDGDYICSERILKLSGRKKYSIQYSIVKEYNIREDYYIGFRAKYIVKNLRVSLDLPDDVEATFVCRGTQKDFQIINKSKKRIETKYKGIVLPRQGYIFVLKEK